MKTIRVAAAIICDDMEEPTKIFATAKGYGEFKGQWEFPGGKIEAGESAQEALVREIMEELESIIEKMEDRESTLEESFACFETGMKLVKECSQRIDKVEKRIMVLSEENVEEYGS